MRELNIPTIVTQALRSVTWSGKRVLLIVPDGTRTAPIGEMFSAIFQALHGQCQAMDVMFALGTHPPMSEEAMCSRLGISPIERTKVYGSVQLLNHAWDDPASLTTLGQISASEVQQLTGGRFGIDVEVRINRAVREYDHLLIVGPVFPHEVAGFSGGNKYLFPGISGPEVLNFFHWLGAVISNAEIIGVQETAVRRVIERAAAMVPTPCHAFCMVVKGPELVSMEFGPTYPAWQRAAAMSAQTHIVHKLRPFHTVLSCAPPMYDELWVGGKCMYKLEPVVADGGELIIYAPHIHEISRTHGVHIERIGYHVRDYYLAQWELFQNEPWGVLAHSTHVKGGGTFVDGVEKARITVTLATGIPEHICRKVNLGYRDPASIRLEDYADRESEGILMVPNAGEILYRLA